MYYVWPPFIHLTWTLQMFRDGPIAQSVATTVPLVAFSYSLCLSERTCFSEHYIIEKLLVIPIRRGYNVYLHSWRQSSALGWKEEKPLNSGGGRESELMRDLRGHGAFVLVSTLYSVLFPVFEGLADECSGVALTLLNMRCSCEVP